MKLRCSSSKLIPANKRKKFSKMLLDDYFSNNITKIQMALNKKRFLPLDYYIRRTKSKIDSGISLRLKKQEDNSILNSYRNELEKKRIPEELEKLLLQAEKKFLAQSEKFYTLKNYNDQGLAYWHYINEKSKKKKQEIFNKKFFNNENNNVNLYSDRIQKLSETMFITNPLLITQQKIDIFFYYLGQFNKYYFNQKKYEHIKKKVITFLGRLKDFLDYTEIKADSHIDSIGKEIKLRNSKFIKELNTRIKAELKSMSIKQKKLNRKENISSKNMIHQTKKSLESINKDKYFFEDPIYFDKNFFVKKNYIFKTRNLNNKNNFNLSAPNFTQNINYNKMNQTNKMSTASTGFFANEKKRTKKLKLNTKPESCKNRDEIVINDNNLNFKKIKVKQSKIDNKRVISALNIPNNKIILNKANTIKSNKSKNILFNKTENHKNSEINSATSSFYNNKEQDNKRKLFNNNIVREKRFNSLKHKKIEDSKNINMFSPIMNDKIIKMAQSGEQPMIKINKNILKKKTFNNIITKNMFKFNNKLHSEVDIRLRNKKQKTAMGSSNSLIFINNRNSNDFSSNDKSKTKSKIELTSLYESLKSKHKINNFELNDINSYFSQKGKKIRNNLKLMEIITQVKKNMKDYDIEHKTKKVFQSNLNPEQNERLNQVREINQEIENLGIYYMNSIFDFKSRIHFENNEVKI